MYKSYFITKFTIVAKLLFLLNAAIILPEINFKQHAFAFKSGQRFDFH